MTAVTELLSGYSAYFNNELNNFFPLPHDAEKKVVKTMRYSVMNGGKRLRPFLVAETAGLFGISRAQSLRTAVALEMLHSYSLVHDDLPAMDNDDLRRGKPTCHRQFDEATAILAGDGLLTYAFEILSDEKTFPDADVRCRLVNMLGNAAGAFNGMISGQMLDLYAEKIPCPKNPEQLIKNIEEMKTGRLIRFACEAGAVLGRAAAREFSALTEYARKIGVAFQIADDILDVEGDEKLMGKALQKDKNQGKVTFVTVYGLENAKKIAEELINSAKNILEIFGSKAGSLKDLADYVINRKN